ncbi:MAG: sigma-70 family RNA polymerase sigma factor [Lachnospiraceae bacterium]|nr:sigma-70 family RNA polymerase sigma factor [Lachnospiraceae bacterium]
MIALYLSLIEGEEEKSKFEKLYYKYRNLLYYIASQMLNSEHDAEDAVQEALIRIAKNMDKIGDVDSSETKNFVAVIVKREACRIADKNSKYAVVSDEALENVSGNSSSNIVNDVVKLIDMLPGEMSSLMQLKYVFGYSGKEISEITGLTEVNIRQKLFRAKKMLEKMMEE